MAITTDKELFEAVQEAGRLLQEIQDYCGSNKEENVPLLVEKYGGIRHEAVKS